MPEIKHDEHQTRDIFAPDEQHCALSRWWWLHIWVSGWERLHKFFLLFWWLSLRGMAWKQDACPCIQNWLLLSNILPNCFWPLQPCVLDWVSLSHINIRWDTVWVRLGLIWNIWKSFVNSPSSQYCGWIRAEVSLSFDMLYVTRWECVSEEKKEEVHVTY